jgi:hypothetical protein
MNIIDKPNPEKSLIEIVQVLKANTFKWARIWTLNGTPEDRLRWTPKMRQLAKVGPCP